ncbi:MAG TPA: hypothetical protein VL171_12370 [Verrucomicrobiae bacterium]|nr:hypothetical protein [Verrucomicrobiae bacterium]
MKQVLCILALALIGAANAQEASKRPSLIQWEPYDCSKPLMLPKGQYDASQFGKGEYRIDNAMSVGHFNNIYIIFQATNSLSPASVAGATESTFTIKDQKVTWRSYKTVIEGRSVIRQEALMPNTLPHERKGAGSDYIWIRIDADSHKILDRLTPVAEGILRDAS